MVRDDIVTMIKQRMGNNQDSSLNSLIVLELQLAQAMLEQEASLPWFLKLYTSFTGAVDDASPSLTFTRGGVTCAFLGLLDEEDSVAFYLSSGTSAEATTLSEYTTGDASKNDRNSWYEVNSQGHSVAYTRNFDAVADESVLTVYPTPAVEWKLIVGGFWADQPLSSNIENLWAKYAPDLLIGKVGAIVAGQYNSMANYVPLFMQQEQTARKRLQTLNVYKEEAGIRLTMGDA